MVIDMFVGRATRPTSRNNAGGGLKVYLGVQRKADGYVNNLSFPKKSGIKSSCTLGYAWLAEHESNTKWIRDMRREKSSLK